MLTDRENVVSLHGDPLPHEPVRPVVEFLERLLAEAKAGRVRSIGAAWVGVDHASHTFKTEPCLTQIMLLQSVASVMDLELTNLVRDMMKPGRVGG